MRSITRAAVLLAASTFTLAGCGSDGDSGDGGDSGDSGDGGGQAEAGFTDKSAEEIKAAAVEEMKSLSTLSMKGEVTSGSEKIGLDISLSKDGDCEGSISAEGATAQIISVGGSTFLKGDESFWSVSTGNEQQGAAMATLIGDRWVDAGAAGGFDEICDLDGFLENFDDSADDDPVEKGETKDIEGSEAIGISSKDDAGDETIGWVATGENHYLLRMEQVGSDEPGQIDFTNFDEELDIEAPTGDDVVDLSSLG